MKNRILLSVSLLVVFFTGCDDKAPMNELLYPETVYLVGSKNLIIDRYVDIGYAQDTVYASVAISGSIPTDRDVTVEVEEFPQAIMNYNDKERGADDILYQNLPPDTYELPNPHVIVKKGEAYEAYPVYIKPETLHIDSLYMISLTLKSTSDFVLAKQDTVVLMRLNLTNQYSGLYYMDGVIKEVSNPNDSVVYKSPRTLQAVVDGNTVRMYHQKIEWSKGSTDYRPDFCFTITVNPDNSLTLKSWDKFQIIRGEGMYYPDLEVYDLSYTFMEDGLEKITTGFLYKERKNDDEQRIINDWMEEQRQ